MAYSTDLWHGSSLPRPKLQGGPDGGIHLGSREQAEMRASAFLHRVSFDKGRERRCIDKGGDWSAKISSARRASCTSIVYLNRFEGVSPESLERISAMRDPDRVGDAAWRRAVPECHDSWIALYPEDVRVLEIVPGPGHVTLWHGTTAANARDLLANGFSPEGWRSGGNGGRRGHLYLTTDAEDARWFSNEMGEDVVLKIRIPANQLIVDPEDGIHDHVWEYLCGEMPGKLATRMPIPALAFRLVEPAPSREPEMDGP